MQDQAPTTVNESGTADTVGTNQTQVVPETFSQVMFRFHMAESNLEHALSDVGFDDFEKIGGDSYDNSIEFYKVGNDARLNEAAQKIVYDAGFSKAYVNHSDGWETHYSWPRGSFTPARGWRRRYMSDPAATTTNVISGPPNPGYYEISYWPEGWTRKEWLETGYMRIVPDPLELVPSVPQPPSEER